MFKLERYLNVEESSKSADIFLSIPHRCYTDKIFTNKRNKVAVVSDILATQLLVTRWNDLSYCFLMNPPSKELTLTGQFNTDLSRLGSTTWSDCGDKLLPLHSLVKHISNYIQPSAQQVKMCYLYLSSNYSKHVTAVQCYLRSSVVQIWY
jgi:hypothetical protein